MLHRCLRNRRDCIGQWIAHYVVLQRQLDSLRQLAPEYGQIDAVGTEQNGPVAEADFHDVRTHLRFGIRSVRGKNVLEA